MEFDELRELWKDLGTSEEGVTIERRLLRSLGADRLRSGLAKLRLRLWLELLSAVPILLLTGSYLADNIGTVRYAVPAMMLHLAVLTAIIVPIRQLYVLGQLDFSDPVVAIQRRLSELRVSRVKVEGSALVLAPLLWTPLAIVGAHGLLGLDLYVGFGAPWIVANVALGVAVLLIALWAGRRHGACMARSPFWGRVADGLAGRSLVEAQGYLADVEAFERAT